MDMGNIREVFLFSILFGLLYFAGIVLALVYWRRCPAICSLVFAASLLHLISSWIQFVGDPAGIPHMLPIVGSVSTAGIIEWVAYGLMLVAVFTGRNELARPRPIPVDDDWTPPKSLGTKPESTGIQQRKP
jgi:hypothetical protein